MKTIQEKRKQLLLDIRKRSPYIFTSHVNSKIRELEHQLTDLRNRYKKELDARERIVIVSKAEDIKKDIKMYKSVLDM
jgi:hypothetical protein